MAAIYAVIISMAAKYAVCISMVVICAVCISTVAIYAVCIAKPAIFAVKPLIFHESFAKAQEYASFIAKPTICLGFVIIKAIVFHQLFIAKLIITQGFITAIENTENIAQFSLLVK